MNPLGHRHILTRHSLLLGIPHGTQPVEQARKMYFNIKKNYAFWNTGKWGRKKCHQCHPHKC